MTFPHKRNLGVCLLIKTHLRRSNVVSVAFTLSKVFPSSFPYWKQLNTTSLRTACTYWACKHLFFVQNPTLPGQIANYTLFGPKCADQSVPTPDPGIRKSEIFVISVDNPAKKSMKELETGGQVQGVTGSWCSRLVVTS